LYINSIDTAVCGAPCASPRGHVCVCVYVCVCVRGYVCVWCVSIPCLPMGWWAVATCHESMAATVAVSAEHGSIIIIIIISSSSSNCNTIATVPVCAAVAAIAAAVTWCWPVCCTWQMQWCQAAPKVTSYHMQKQQQQQQLAAAFVLQFEGCHLRARLGVWRCAAVRPRTSGLRWDAWVCCGMRESVCGVGGVDVVVLPRAASRCAPRPLVCLPILTACRRQLVLACVHALTNTLVHSLVLPLGRAHRTGAVIVAC
jgi:hypothetical protein